MDFSNKNIIDIDKIVEYIISNPDYLIENSARKNSEKINDKKNKDIEIIQLNENKIQKNIPKKGYLRDIPDDYGAIKIKDLTRFIPSLPIQRVPSYILGPGVLGRCYVGTTLIQVRDDLYGKDFLEVDVHELKHSISPHMSEYQVRFWTRAMFDYTRYN